MRNKKLSGFGLPALLLVMSLAVFAGCNNPAQISGPGGGGGGGGGGSQKPALLSTNASYEQAMAKIDEGLAYCNNNPNDMNNTAKQGFAEYKHYIMPAPIYRDNWTNNGSFLISGINTLIEMLQ
jgi:hypothetical protein